MTPTLGSATWAALSKVGIDNYEALIGPILSLAARDGGEKMLADIRSELASELSLSAGALSETLPSGRGNAFDHQLQWALTYLTREGQLELLENNTYRVTPVGYDALATLMPDVDCRPATRDRRPESSEHSDDGFSEPAAQWMGNDQMRSEAKTLAVGSRLEDQIRHHFELAYQKQKKVLIERAHAKSPAFFEQLVLDLILAMGYAQHRQELAKSLGRSGDGGVDGVLHEDELGLNRIYFQAKRYKPGLSVPISAVRDFAGSLEAHKANRGVFLTTSHFPRSAEKFAASISKRIVLIDGDRLASLMMRHRIGVKLCAVYEVKVIDECYFSRDILP
jgi:restriction system protein